MTRDKKPEILNAQSAIRNFSSGTKVVRLKKSHPCGSSEFTVIRNSVVVTLKCNTCGSFVRFPKDKYLKAVKGES